MDKLISRIRDIPDCIVYPVSSLPTIEPNHMLSADVHRFYELCGGLILFEHEAFTVEIVPPDDVVLANSVIFVGLSEEQLLQTKAEMSWSWYIIARGESGEYITIDFAQSRLGRCYYSFWDRHAMKGCSPVIALSFTELLQSLLENEGQQRYWEQPGFKSLGDAYD